MIYSKNMPNYKRNSYQKNRHLPRSHNYSVLLLVIYITILLLFYRIIIQAHKYIYIHIPVELT